MRVLPSVPPATIEALAAFGRYAAARGWVPATAGNFSCRIDAVHVALTRSGVDKGDLGPGDVSVVALDGRIPAGVSAEAPLHLARYRSDRNIGAVFHVHTVASTVLSRADVERGVVRTHGYEMHKALTGYTTHRSAAEIPVFRNDQDTVALATEIEAALGRGSDVPAYLLEGHGLYAWGATAGDARRHVEAIEFLLACHLEERRTR